MTSSSIPSKQTAAVLRGAYGQHHSVENDYPVTLPGPNEALIHLEASGICAGDVNPREGYPPAPPTAIRPLVTGHEGIGHIVALGECTSGFAVGDRIGMGWRRSTCHECDPCRKNSDNLCQAAVINGYLKDGTFQEYATLPVSDLIRIPASDRKAVELAPLLCAGGTALAGVRAAGVQPGNWLCVTGAAGGVGSLAVQYAKELGCRVVAIDSEKKRAHCEALGAVFVGYEESDKLLQRIRDATGGGPQGTVVCSANPASYAQAVEYSGIGASIVSIGPSMLHVHTGHLMVKGLKLIGQSNGSKKDIEDALALSNKGIVPNVEIVPIASIDGALDKLKTGQVVGRQVLVFR